MKMSRMRGEKQDDFCWGPIANKLQATLNKKQQRPSYNQRIKGKQLSHILISIVNQTEKHTKRKEKKMKYNKIKEMV